LYIPTWLSPRGRRGWAETLIPTLPILPCREPTCLKIKGFKKEEIKKTVSKPVITESITV